MYLRALELFNLKKEESPYVRNFLRKNYIVDTVRPMVLGRNEDNECQNRNSILLLYVR